MTTATDCLVVVEWADGLAITMKSVRIKRWATPRRCSGIGLPTVTEGSRRTGRRCKCVLQGKRPRSSSAHHLLPAARGRSFEIELENRPPLAVEKGTQEKRRGRAAEIPNSLLSLSKMVQARGNTDRTETGAASKNASLKNAPSGTNIGVHLKIPKQSERSHQDQARV